MKNITLVTDAGCDLSPEILNEWNIKCSYLTYTFENDEKIYSNLDMSVKDFYTKMRNGEVAKTSGVNPDYFKALFEEELKLGNDIIYMGVSSGLSVTYNSAKLAAEELRDVYPDNTIYLVDTLCASAGVAMLLYIAKNMRDEEKSAKEIADYITELAPSIAHWFTVDDLVYLKRGGRVSAATAVIGGILNIKPVMHVDDEGHLINMFKARGRKQSIKMLADKYTEYVKDKTAPVFISHGDCLADAEALAEIIKAEHGVEVSLITDVGASIGAHSGPGTLALFFIATQR